MPLGGAFLSTDGVGSGLPIRRPFISSVGVGGSFEQMRMYVEIIPRKVADVMREPFKNITERGGLKNDAIGFETLNDAIFNAEHIGSCILGEVKAENLLFIFGQTLESIGYVPIELSPSPPFFDEADYIGGNRDNKKRHGDNKGKAENRAIILCKLRNTDLLKELATWKKEDSRHKAERYEITWCELQELKKCLGDFGGDHLKLPNVMYTSTAAVYICA
ncbi:MAG: hypothetical protein RL748_1209 [Pseudomonadota bacterium]